MRVTFDHQIFSLQKYGGISRYFVELSNHLAAGTNVVNIVAPVYYNSHLQEIGNGELITGVHLDLNFRSAPRLYKLVNDLSAGSFIKRFNPDIFHETYYNSTFKIDAPRVTTVHDMNTELFDNFFGRENQSSLLKRQSVQKADHIICVSNNTQKDLLRLFGVDESKTSVVYHGYTPYTREKSPAIKTPKEPFILFVGRRDGYKNFSRMLAAFSMSARLAREFNLIAFGHKPFSADEARELKRLRIDDRVFQISGSDALLNALYQEAVAFIYPSEYEGFGIPLLEAMHNGCPIACSNTSCFPEIAGEAALYFDPLNEEQIKESMESIVYNSAIRREKIKIGQERVVAFSWSKCAENTQQVYNKLL